MAYLRKVKTGWQININYTDPATRKRKRKTKVVRGTKPQAEKVMADMIKKYDSGIPLANGDITLEEYLNLWLDEKKNNISYRSWQGYNSIIQAHIIPALGKIPLKDIKPYHIKKYIAEKREKGRIEGEGGLSERTLNYHYVTLNSALGQAVTDEIIEKNPCQPVKSPKPENKKRDMNVLTFEEVNELLDRIKGNWFYPIVFLAVNTGMRRGEICALKWEDVNFYNQVLTVFRSIVRVKGKGLVEKTTKRKSSDRAIDFGDDVKAFLEKQYKKLERIRSFAHGYNPDNRVFTMPEGHTIDPDYISFEYSKLIKEIGFKHHTFHDLRHTHASLMLQSGGDNIMKILQERLGHASIKTTMDIYGHLMPGMQKKAASIFEQNLKMRR